MFPFFLFVKLEAQFFRFLAFFKSYLFCICPRMEVFIYHNLMLQNLNPIFSCVEFSSCRDCKLLMMQNVFPISLSTKFEARCFWLLGIFGKNLLSLYLRLFGTGTTRKLTLFAHWNSIFKMSTCWIWQPEKRFKTYLRQILPAEFQIFLLHASSIHLQCCAKHIWILPHNFYIVTFKMLTIEIIRILLCSIMLKFLRLPLF